MSTDKHINYLEFPCSDFAVTEAFFSKVFDWQFQHWGDEYMSFSNAGLEGGFYRATKTSDHDAGAALVVIYANDLEETYTRVKAAGAKVVKEIFEFPGGRRFHFKEPSGNELAVWSAQ
ncbi:MAG: VOC family protein [Agarilytica sp.]